MNLTNIDWSGRRQTQKDRQNDSSYKKFSNKRTNMDQSPLGHSESAQELEESLTVGGAPGCR